MKKFMLLAAVSATFIMCKKTETAQSQIEKAVHATDSIATSATETIENAGNTVDKVLDSASIRIKDFDATQDDIQKKMENTSKIVDSLSEKIASGKLESKAEKKDSIEKKSEKIVVNVPAPKIIKETKIIYKDKPKNGNDQPTPLKDRMIKSGQLSISANNAETVKEIIKEETLRNNGYIRHENLSYIESADYRKEDQKVYTIDIKVPIRHFDGLMDALSHNTGDIESKNIEVSGTRYTENAICSISVQLTDKAETEKIPETFGEKSLAAVASGWEVITSIFLFILPLWPLFLLGGIGYYFYQKKNKKVPGKNSQ